jgi:hypothetical protein
MMRFFGGGRPPRNSDDDERRSRPLADPGYVQAVLAQLTAVFDQTLDLPGGRSRSVDTLTFADVVGYFTDERPDDPRIKAGALLSAGHPRGRVIFQVFLDDADRVCGDASGTPYGRRVIAGRLDDELNDYLGGGELLIFQ